MRATLPAGHGIAFPVEVAGAADGRYHLDVLSLGAPWTGRLEDAEGWPVVTPGTLDGTEARCAPGRYRLVVTPDAVARQVVARLTRIEPPAEITGHGPHPCRSRPADGDLARAGRPRPAARRPIAGRSPWPARRR